MIIDITFIAITYLALAIYLPYRIRWPQLPCPDSSNPFVSGFLWMRDICDIHGRRVEAIARLICLLHIYLFYIYYI